MTAWPMIARCKQAQWQSLSKLEQRWLEQDWAAGTIITLIQRVPQRVSELWRVVGKDYSLLLMSVKETDYEAIRE